MIPRHWFCYNEYLDHKMVGPNHASAQNLPFHLHGCRWAIWGRGISDHMLIYAKCVGYYISKQGTWSTAHTLMLYSECHICTFTHNSSTWFSFFSSSPSGKGLDWEKGCLVGSALSKANIVMVFKLRGTWIHLFQTSILRKTTKWKELKTSKL